MLRPHTHIRLITRLEVFSQNFLFPCSYAHLLNENSKNKFALPFTHIHTYTHNSMHELITVAPGTLEPKIMTGNII